MKRLAGALVLVASVAHASPTPLVMPPADWQEDPEASSALSVRAAQTHPLGDVAASTAAKAYVPADKGIALYVTRASAETAGAHGPPARAALDAFLAAPERAKGLGATVTVGDKQDTVDAQQRVLTLAWTDTAQGITTTGRLVIAANKVGLVAVTGECIASAEVAPALTDACKQALATIDTGIPVADRVAIVVGDAAAPAPAASPPAPSAEPRMQQEPARLEDGDRLRMIPMAVSSSRETDRRPVYVGAGIVVLALVFWWNRRRRDEIDRAQAREEGRDASPPSDDDADDLRAAARGDSPKDEDA